MYIFISPLFIFMKQEFSKQFQKAKLHFKNFQVKVSRVWGLAKHLEPSHVRIDRRKPKQAR
jgi:hypothetical protein